MIFISLLPHIVLQDSSSRVFYLSAKASLGCRKFLAWGKRWWFLVAASTVPSPHVTCLGMDLMD